MTSSNNGTKARQDSHAEDIPKGVRPNADETSSTRIWPTPLSIEAATLAAQEATQRFNTALGFSDEDRERQALRSRQNLEAIMQSSTALTNALQESTGGWLGMLQGQWKRHVDGMNRLMQAKSVHEFGAIQGELVRENLEYIIKDSCDMTERSIRAADEAGKSLARIKTENASGKK